jgi:hypothetical protein
LQVARSTASTLSGRASTDGAAATSHGDVFGHRGPSGSDPTGGTMNDITITVLGNLVNDVEMRFTKSGEPVASFRLAAGTRRYDRANGRWVDGDTHYFTVSCWQV